MRSAARMAISLSALVGVVLVPVGAHAGNTGSISGRVTTADEPLENVCVIADAGGDEQYTTRTLSDGTYTVVVYAPLNVRVYFADCVNQVYASDYESDRYFVDEGQHVTGVDSSLVVGGSITGRVIDRDGAPIAGLCVRVLGPERRQSLSAADGSYRVGGLLAGDYRVRYADCDAEEYVEALYSDGGSPYIAQWYNDSQTWQDATPVHVVLGTETPGIDASLALGGEIDGTVSIASFSGPGVDTCIWAQTSPEAWIRGQLMVWGPAQRAFHIRGLPSGRYKVRFDDCSGYAYPPRWYHDADTFEEGTYVELGLGETVGGVDTTIEPLDAKPLDLAVTNLSLRDESVLAGSRLRIVAEFSNVGGGPGLDSLVEVWARPIDPDRPNAQGHLIAREDIQEIPSGATLSRTYLWDTTGRIGSWSIWAAICSIDADITNDVARVDHDFLVHSPPPEALLPPLEPEPDHCSVLPF